jgi:hypothetical protein
MAAITGCTTKQLGPNANIKAFWIATPATADSNDTIDVSDVTATGDKSNILGTIYGVYATDQTSADAVTATWSSTTITLDAAGGTTNHVYNVFVWGID